MSLLYKDGVSFWQKRRGELIIFIMLAGVYGMINNYMPNIHIERVCRYLSLLIAAFVTYWFYKKLFIDKKYREDFHKEFNHVFSPKRRILHYIIGLPIYFGATFIIFYSSLGFTFPSLLHLVYHKEASFVMKLSEKEERSGSRTGFCKRYFLFESNLFPIVQKTRPLTHRNQVCGVNYIFWESVESGDKISLNGTFSFFGFNPESFSK